MNKRIQFIQHKGREIIHLDYSNLEEKEYLQAIADTTEVVQNQSTDPKNNLNLHGLT